MPIYYVGSYLYDSNYLEHHGVKGQRWGVRRFQNPDGSLTALGRSRYGTVENFNRVFGTTDSGSSASSSSVRSNGKVDHNAEDGVRREAAKLAVNTTLQLVQNPAAAAINLGSRLAQAGIAKVKTDKYFKDREKNGEIDKKTGLYKKKEEMNDKQDLSKVNPEFKSFNTNSKNNCMLCTATFDLRKRGFDVTANKASIGYNYDDVKKWYPKAKLEQHSSTNEKGRYSNKTMRENVKSSLAKQGPGARGNLMVMWANSYGGHSMVYTVGKNGKITILDGQTGKIYKNPDKILKRCNSATTARLDNVEPDWKKIKEVCR